MAVWDTVTFNAQVRPTAPDGYNLVVGTHGADTLTGTDQPHIYSVDGHDYIYGGRGNDTLKGGSGADVYVIERYSGHDVIDDPNDSIILGGFWWKWAFSNRVQRRGTKGHPEI